MDIGDFQEEAHEFTEDDGKEEMSKTSNAEDDKLAHIRQRLQKMEKDAKQLSEASNYMDSHSDKSSSVALTDAEKLEADTRSIYIGNVEYSATAEDLQKHFLSCGAINRITIQCDKFTGNPKGYAYIEFQDRDAVDAAMALDESLFVGRQIKVMPKRHNVPGISTTNRPPRGRFRSRGSRGGFGFSGHYGGVRKPRFPGFRRRGGYGFYY